MRNEKLDTRQRRAFVASEFFPKWTHGTIKSEDRCLRNLKWWSDLLVRDNPSLPKWFWPYRCFGEGNGMKTEHRQSDRRRLESQNIFSFLVVAIFSRDILNSRLNFNLSLSLKSSEESRLTGRRKSSKRDYTDGMWWKTRWLMARSNFWPSIAGSFGSWWMKSGKVMKRVSQSSLPSVLPGLDRHTHVQQNLDTFQSLGSILSQLVSLRLQNIDHSLRSIYPNETL